MRILISNDDGIAAAGLNALLTPLQAAGHELIVAAPTWENSASSHAITVHDPIFVEEYEFAGKTKIKAWSIGGRPADCVKMALEVLLDKPPDIVISGINRGPNMGMDTVYSGTVSAALEASMHGIPAMAVSLDSRSRKADYQAAAQITVKVLSEYHKFCLPPTSMLNVNVPDIAKEQIKGIRVTGLGTVAYDNIFAARKDLQGRTYYWLGGEIVTEVGDNLFTDVDAVGNGWVAVTPLQYDLTDYSALEKIKEIKI